MILKLLRSILPFLLLSFVAQAQAPIKDGAILAEFSVSDSTKVYFSQGNLLYKAIPWWWFAEHQWNRTSTYEYDYQDDYYEEDIDPSANVTFNIFPWGTSGYNGKNPNLISVITRTSRTIYNYGDGTNDIAGTNYDWGVYNKIFNGGDKAGLWRTLTKEEWIYLINSRANASEKYGVANVEGVNGLILLPDKWKLPKDIVFTSGVTDYNTEIKRFATVNNYTASEWARMEACGAVFLPTLYTPSDVIAIGYYWSSSACGDEKAYCLIVLFNSGYAELRIGCTPRRDRLAVRLVQDVKK